MNGRNLTLSFVILLLALLLAVVLLWPVPQQPAASRPIPEVLRPLLLPAARPLDAFTLQDHNGAPLTLEQLRGGWSLIFFGYTHCPDICPTTLGTLKGVAQRLEAQHAADTRIIFVSVDPKRDTLSHLREYISYFGPDFIAATGESQEIDNLTHQLGAMYMFDGDTTGNDYIVNHSASVALINPQGEWVARFNPPHTVTKFSSDYLQLRDFLSQQ
ncbi:MAG: SCO family protein [Gammaproteobacteria bacterium]|nr:SCO family protein [Gammaproteobacteria bacterium]